MFATSKHSQFIRCPLVLAVLLLQGPTRLPADDGIWLFNQFPKQAVQQKYNFAVTDDFLNRMRLGSVRFLGLASGSFVSPNGLLFTNHHVASECIQQLSSKERDYMGNGFLAASETAEPKCPDLEADVLLSMTDVTAEVQSGVPANAMAADAARTRRVNMARIEKDCAGADGSRCEVVTLYSGQQYHLYRYKKYTDIRLVFAPEDRIASFGGDIDNFTYPRYCLDIVFFRAYENGRPAATPDYLHWSKEGVKEGELIFVAGSPASTGRLNTVAQLEFLRDTSYPFVWANLGSLIKTLQSYSKGSVENRRVAADNLNTQQNSYKAYTGYLAGLRDPGLMASKQRQEQALRAAVAKDSQMAENYGTAWDRMAAAYRECREFYQAYWLLEIFATRGSDLFKIARDVSRLAVERGKPDGQRLPEYRDAALPGLESSVYAEIPISDSMEIVVLANYLNSLRHYLGASDPLVRSLLGGRKPAGAARQYVSTSKLRDVAERKRLANDAAAVQASADGMIRLALAIDARARELRGRFEDRVDAVVSECGPLVAQASFAVNGPTLSPDATFTPRVSYGPVKGYLDNSGKPVPYTTDFGGLFRRAKNKEPFILPPAWLNAKPSLALATPFNFVSTADTHGGNSGSPTVNTRGDVVGVLFDGNLEGLPNRFLYSEEQARSVHVASQGIVEALRKVYGATRLLSELGVQ
jgi:hypothetical protein